MLRSYVFCVSMLVALCVAPVGHSQLPRNPEQPEKTQLSDKQRQPLLAQREQLRTETGNLLAQGKRDQAIESQTRILHIEKLVFGLHHPDAFRSMDQLARFHKTSGDFDESHRLYKRMLSTAESNYTPDHWTVRHARLGLRRLDEWTTMEEGVHSRLLDAIRSAEAGASLLQQQNFPAAAPSDSGCLSSGARRQR